MFLLEFLCSGETTFTGVRRGCHYTRSVSDAAVAAYARSMSPQTEYSDMRLLKPSLTSFLSKYFTIFINVTLFTVSVTKTKVTR